MATKKKAVKKASKRKTLRKAKKLEPTKPLAVDSFLKIDSIKGEAS